MEDIKLYSMGGLKYEYLFEKSIKIEIASAYGLVEEKSHTAQSKTNPKKRIKAVIKEIFKDNIVNPIFYNAMKAGVGLASISRKPV